ncbi:7672_t:CDS:1, partial [Gigaspora rosea]
MNFQSGHVAESSTSAIINFNNSKLDSDTEMLQDSESKMYNQNSNSETITSSE